jgi:ABC-type dipeptide/oligopeptide/nickel transport system permease component
MTTFELLIIGILCGVIIGMILGGYAVDKRNRK